MNIAAESNIEQYHLHKNEPDKLQFEIYGLNEYLSDSNGCASKPHVHSFYQIIWFSGGKGCHYVDFDGYNVVENSIFFIPKGQIHYFDNNTYEGYIIHFNEEFLSDDKNEINTFLKHNIFNSFENEPFFIIAKNNVNNIMNILKQMQDEMLTPNQFAHRQYMKILLNMFLIIIQRFGIRNSCHGLSINNPSHILFVKFRGLLEKHYHKIHTVSQYASLLNVSNKTLTNCTKEVMHQTPLEIINERISLEAKRLLSYSDKNINEIAFDLGFEDPSYFVKFFKRQINMLPSNFRKTIS